MGRLFSIEWGRKYGIRIYLDLHALPGSQNGWVRLAVMFVLLFLTMVDRIILEKVRPNSIDDPWYQSSVLIRW